ncbi:MAG: 2'-5' RNA ligase family protein [Chloroflexi bacterium]|nr:2'-5' RNA ligase family protein [Chloroflexota bacterium]MDA1145543.1 2'-5' RNA ligase family protein [Chloroflexota bacterium]
MPVFVLAIPEFSETDSARIEAIRAEHDPQHTLVPPQVTLVFAIDSIDASDAHAMRTLEAHTRIATARQRAFDVVFRAATLYPASTPTEDDYTFLVPDEGNSRLIRLHDALHTGMLATERRLDLPYVPHVTIARGTPPAMATLATTWNAEEPPIQARIAALDIVELASGAATTLVRVALA